MFAVIVCSSAAAAFLIPNMIGSGAMRQNPTTAFVGLTLWASSIVFVWWRIFEDRPASYTLGALVAGCGSIALLAVPYQWRVLLDDPGHPQPRLRPELLWPGLVATVAVMGAAVGLTLLNRGR